MCHGAIHGRIDLVSSPAGLLCLCFPHQRQKDHRGHHPAGEARVCSRPILDWPAGRTAGWRVSGRRAGMEMNSLGFLYSSEYMNPIVVA